MTAEVAILNCSGVALAADSAVTVGSQKIYNSAIKLFALSKVSPVAVMVYGNAALSRIPWEVVIKEYRRNLKGRRFAALEGYALDFQRFISESPLLFDQGTEQAWLTERTHSILLGIFKAATEACEIALENKKGEGLTVDDVNRTFEEVVQEQLEAVLSWDDLKPPRAVLTRVNSSIKTLVANIGPEIYGDLYTRVKTRLTKIVQQAFRRAYFPHPSSGVVIAGYGESEIFPSIRTLEFDGAVAGFSRHKLDLSRTQSISAGTNPAVILAFAQEDMVATFMEGINPAVKTFLESTLSSVFSELPGALLRSLDIDSGERKTMLESVCEEVRAQLSKSAREYRFQEHVMPVLNMVMSLPKDELAAMAESLVNLTAFKRRVTGTLETVGGPIDVCVITKGDGLVWVKRKHYFPPELNLLFAKNYLRDLQNEEAIDN
jgi:hypothetical protein